MHHSEWGDDDFAFWSLTFACCIAILKGINMFTNYLKLAVRNLLRQRLTSFINLFGLTIGLACCLLITTYILNELSYDRASPNAGDIYRVTRIFNNQDGVVSLHLGTVSPPFGYYLPTDFPEIKRMTRIYHAGTVAMRYRDNLLNEYNTMFG